MHEYTHTHTQTYTQQASALILFILFPNMLNSYIYLLFCSLMAHVCRQDLIDRPRIYSTFLPPSYTFEISLTRPNMYYFYNNGQDRSPHISGRVQLILYHILLLLPVTWNIKINLRLFICVLNNKSFQVNPCF